MATTFRTSFGADLAELDVALGLVRRVVRDLEVGRLSGSQAIQMAGVFGELERASSSGLARLTPVVSETGSYAKDGFGSVAEWLGQATGTSAGAAKGRLAAAERASVSPELGDALKKGALSADQLDVVAKTTGEVPDAPATLLPLLDAGASHQELKAAAERLVAGARSKESERVRRARVHATRHCRSHQVDSGGVRTELFCDETQWAKVAPLIEAEAKARWKAAGAKEGESLEAYRLDAVIDRLAGSGGTGSGGNGARVETLVLIDAAALRQGTTVGDELCEIEGIGAVSVEAATELLGQGALRFLVKEGFDIKTVTKSTRDIERCIDLALIARDRTCAKPGCGKRLGLERDHLDEYGVGGPSELDNLVRLCPEHHALKTHGGWRLEGEPGHRRWVAPKQPKSARYITGSRRLAAAKAKANRNKPQRT